MSLLFEVRLASRVQTVQEVDEVELEKRVLRVRKARKAPKATLVEARKATREWQDLQGWLFVPITHQVQIF
jgi:hypothetical protein